MPIRPHPHLHQTYQPQPPRRPLSSSNKSLLFSYSPFINVFNRMAQAANTNIRILVVEDQPLAQKFLRYALQNLGYSKIDLAEQAQNAIDRCTEEKYQLILCSFDISKGQDGYQLYEELKERQLLQLSTAFIFISAETEPGLVHSVIELQPDDFLVKPFTLKELDTRISRVLNRKGRLKDVYQALDENNVHLAIKLIDKHFADAHYAKSIPQMLRIKGELLLQLEDFTRAQSFFISVLRMQKLTWAKIGLIKCLIALKQESAAFTQLELLAKQPATQLEALELISDIQFGRNEYNLALDNIKKAASLSPRNIHRQDKLVNIARINHDYESQYKAHRDIVKYSKNSSHEKPDVYLNVVRSGIDYALTNYNEEQMYRTIKQANEYITELKTTFPEAEKDDQINIINARIHYLKDEKDKAKQLIGDVADAEDTPISSLEDELDKAKSFHELGFYDQSIQLFEKIDKYCQQHSSENAGIGAYIKQEKRQRQEIKSSPKELNNDAVNFYQSGNYSAAFNAFRQAFILIPGNSSIALNLLQTIVNNQAADKDEAEIKTLINQCLEVVNKGGLENDQEVRLKVIREKLAEDAAAP